MRATIFHWDIIQTDQGPQGCSQYDGIGEYCGLSTASEVFLIFTTQLCMISNYMTRGKYSNRNTPNP